MKFVKLLTISTLLLLLVSCNELTSGTVVDKWWIPGHYETSIYSTYVGKRWITKMRTRYVASQYYLKITGRTKKEETKTETHYVTLYYYDKYPVGSFYRRDE